MTLIDHINLPRHIFSNLSRNVQKSRIVILILCFAIIASLIALLRDIQSSSHGSDTWQSKIISLNPLFGGPDAHIPESSKQYIGKVSILYGDKKPAYERALKTHEEHNRIHNYRMHLLRHGILDGYWTKPAYILSLLLLELGKEKDDRLSWLFWVDADTVVLNHNIPIEIFMPPPEHNDIHLLVTDDWNGLNNGVFLVRVDPWAVELFTSITSFRDFQPNTTLTFQDQSAMEILLKQPKYAKHTVRVPQRWFNAYKDEKDKELKPDQVRGGDLLVHLAGINPREQLLNEWCDRYEKDPEKWEIKLQNTTYPAETAKFWRDLEMKDV
ncbi:hypothetical protein BKA61DRAFT_576348 [Leptodontidium sp. MPI-SDFR-AT-0119]|nr:hypothetical protein BKA61DRAFT_576348 [Leptodontidium sp. MPI-SDFR-AT-0119]